MMNKIMIIVVLMMSTSLMFGCVVSSEQKGNETVDAL